MTQAGPGRVSWGELSSGEGQPESQPQCCNENHWERSFLRWACSSIKTGDGAISVCVHVCACVCMCVWRRTRAEGKLMNQIKVRLNSFSLPTFNETYPRLHTMPPSIRYPSFFQWPIWRLPFLHTKWTCGAPPQAEPVSLSPSRDHRPWCGCGHTI